MLVIINALKSISRSIGRNVLIGIIVIAIAASSCVALAIRNAANEAETAAKETAQTEAEEAEAAAAETEAAMKGLLNITGSISLDRMKMMETVRNEQDEAANEGPPDMNAMREMMARYQDLTLPELLTYADSEYVEDFYYSSSVSLNATGDLQAYSTEESGGQDAAMPPMEGGGGMVVMDDPGGGGQQQFVVGGMMMAMGDFTVTGYKTEDAMAKFKNGTASIKDGDMIDMESSETNCLVSHELALFNGLSVGDKITLCNPNSDDETYEFTIVGIYTDESSAETGNMPRFSSAQDPANLICISDGALRDIEDDSASVAQTGTNQMGFETSTALIGQISHTFVFADHENYESFAGELTTKGLSEYYTLTSPDLNTYLEQIEQIQNAVGNYEEPLAPIQNLSSFATALFFIILSAGAVILVIINIFNIRERKYEVGVLTAIGIKKSKVAMQFVTELLCVTLAGIIIGAGVGAVASVPVANNLLSGQIEQVKAQEQAKAEAQNRPPDMRNGNFRQGMPPPEGEGYMISAFGSDDPKEVNYLDKINATFNFAILGQLILIGVILTLVSSLAAVVFVMRYEPLKILANRA